MTEWSAHVSYHCSGCSERCINRRESDAAQAGLCWYCFQRQSGGRPVATDGGKSR
jgi:formylmethanofuran dehydrogenase subunit E